MVYENLTITDADWNSMGSVMTQMRGQAFQKLGQAFRIIFRIQRLGQLFGKLGRVIKKLGQMIQRLERVFWNKYLAESFFNETF